MRTILTILLIPSITLAAWYQRGDQWLESSSPLPWTAKGYVERTDLERTIWLCTSSGGTWTNGECVYPPAPPAPEPQPTTFDNGIIAPLWYAPSTPDASNGWVVAVTPDGTLDSAHWYGSPTSHVTEIKAAFASNYVARATNTSRQVAYDAHLGTNTYSRLRSSYRATINAATTNGSTTAQIRNALDAVLKLDRLNRLRERRDLERLENKLPPEDVGE